MAKIVETNGLSLSYIWSLMIFVFYFLMALHVIILAYGSNSLRVFLCFSIFQWGSILLTWDANVHTRRHTCTHSIGPGAPLQQPLQKKELHCPHCHQFFNAINWPQLQLLTVEKWEQTFQEPDRISKGFTVRGNSLGRINLSSWSELGIVLIGEKVLAMVWQSSHLNGEVICMVIVRFFHCSCLRWSAQKCPQISETEDPSICPFVQSSRVPAMGVAGLKLASWFLCTVMVDAFKTLGRGTAPNRDADHARSHEDTGFEARCHTGYEAESVRPALCGHLFAKFWEKGHLSVTTQ